MGPLQARGPSAVGHAAHWKSFPAGQYHLLSTSSPPRWRVAQQRAGMHHSTGSYRGLYLKAAKPWGHWKHFEGRDFMFLLQAQPASSYSTWHPQVLPLKKIPLTSPNVQPCQCCPSILRPLPVVVVSRSHCHRLKWVLCDTSSYSLHQSWLKTVFRCI